MKLSYLIKTFVDYLKTPAIAASEKARNELRDEIEFHLTSSAHDHIQSGMSLEESKNAALQRFGNINSVVRECGDLISNGQFFWHRFHLVTTSLLVFTVGYLVWQTENRDSERTDNASFAEQGELTGDVTGEVFSENGKAISNANVIVVVKHWPENGYRQQSYMTTTLPDGTFNLFDIYPLDCKHEVMVSVVAEGHLMKSDYTTLSEGKIESYHFTLAAAKPLELQFETADGNPIAGVSAFPMQRRNEAGESHQVYFMGSQPIVRTSNRNGRMQLAHFREGDSVSLAVKYPECEEWETQELKINNLNQIAVVRPNE